MVLNSYLNLKRCLNWICGSKNAKTAGGILCSKEITKPNIATASLKAKHRLVKRRDGEVRSESKRQSGDGVVQPGIQAVSRAYESQVDQAGRFQKMAV